jgi:dTDP-4-dehydrorhamnose reductase
MANNKVLILGGSGLLGSSLIPFLKNEGYAVTSIGRSKNEDYVLDLTNQVELSRILIDIRPGYVINLVAATDVDACESDVAMAFKLNSLVPSVVSKAIADCFHQQPYFIQISTDQVYQGNGKNKEGNVCPVNVYGLTKYIGESMIKTSNSGILRTNFFGRSVAHARVSFSDWLVDSFEKKKKITLFQDVRFNALHISSVCSIIHKMMLKKMTGVFNAGCRDGLTKAEFAILLAEHLNLSTEFARIGFLAEMKLKARRPLDMTMDVSKIEEALDIVCPSMSDEIKKASKEYLNA